MYFYFQINTNFSLQLLIISAICLNAIILFLYDIYRNIKADSGNTERLIFYMIFILCYAFRSLYISYVCQRSRNEVEYCIINAEIYVNNII